MPAIDWTAELETAVLDAIESGDTLRASAEKSGISAAAIIRRVLANEQFAKQYARAIDIRTDVDCDGIEEEIAQQPAKTDSGVDHGWVAWKRVQIDTRKWLLSKRNPKKYGDKLTLDGDLKVTRIVVHDEIPGSVAQPALPKPEFEE